MAPKHLVQISGGIVPMKTFLSPCYLSVKILAQNDHWANLKLAKNYLAQNRPIFL